MNARADANESQFDRFASDYDAALDKGLSLTGDSKDFYAQGRIAWLKKRFSEVKFQPTTALDFGCGTGGATRWLLDAFGVQLLLGVDPSEESLSTARKDHANLSTVTFETLDSMHGVGKSDFDFAFCNGVFHHIPVDEQANAVSYVFARLRPGGMFAFWENNPWNPGTRFVMSRIPFDRDAVMVWPGRARRLLDAVGFDVLKTDYLFIFPRPLSVMRVLEPWLCKVPLGGQYLVLGRKPD